jgi:putative NADH-flavin reductase
VTSKHAEKSSTGPRTISATIEAEETMKVLVLGATGPTGQHVVMQAAARGHAVTAFVRDPARLPATEQPMRVVVGTLPEDRAALADAMRGQDAVICSLGRGQSFKSEDLMSRCVGVITSAMTEQSVSRLVFVSAIGVGGHAVRLPLVPKLMTRTLLRDIYRDKTIADDHVRRSSLDWTIVQPVQLTNAPARGTYRSGEQLALRGVPRIARADVARFLIAQLSDPSYRRRTVMVSS